jgi:flavin-dependent dehydrogenase
MPDVEVLIVGAGPSGATAALNLSRARRVALVERKVSPAPRIGESLVPAARRLLADMGILESFLSEGHEPWHGKRAVWGSPVPEETDFLRDPDGHGWHLDRARFENWLRQQASARGAELIAPATVSKVEHDGRSWQVLLRHPQGALTISAEVLIDAGGRARPVARKIGARAITDDLLACVWVYGVDTGRGGRGLTYVEAIETGWWYSAPLPGRRRVLAFHTDTDGPLLRSIRERGALLRQASASRELSALLAEAGFRPKSQVQVTTAQSGLLEPPVGENWLAVGDAAVSFDPISSQGLLNALFTGLAAAEAADRHLAGDDLALFSYASLIRDVYAIYQTHLGHCYVAEQRWPDSVFWRRRHAKPRPASDAN